MPPSQPPFHHVQIDVWGTILEIIAFICTVVENKSICIIRTAPPLSRCESGVRLKSNPPEGPVILGEGIASQDFNSLVMRFV
jgi:hypothetical protein